MADLLVGGAFLSSFLNVLFERMASRKVLDFFRRRKLDVGLLTSLKTRMNTISGVLEDAEEKQISKPAVQTWLNDLKSVAYEADDFLDEIAYEALRLEMEVERHQVRNFLSSLILCKKGMVLGEMEPKLKQILDTLKLLVEQMGPLGLEKGIGAKPASRRVPTTSLLVHSSVYGRDDNKEAIMKMLLSDDANSKNFRVIPIVGMGGIGKTTLAQTVYNDSRVQQWFHLKAWVCVSEEFDLLKLTKDVLMEVGSMNSDKKTENQLHCELREKLAGKKVLLVLDDVWSDDQEKWDFLLTPFEYVAQGSRILVTTRNQKSVASIRFTAPPYHLEKLSIGDCWLVFEKHAFDGESSHEHPHLKIIGEKIVKKCDGLPLAARSLGGLLRSIRDADEWEKMLKSKMWDLKDDKILPALRLSYHYLPSYLKQCFACCAIFPKNHAFKKEELVQYWMAEGFIAQPKGHKEMEEVGGDYFLDLVSRSFFQPISFDPSRFCMHDLTHDLAEFISGEFCINLGYEDSCKPVKATRHLSLCHYKCDIKHIREAQFVRSLHINSFWWDWHSSSDKKEALDFILELRYLRMLSLPYCDDGVKLLKSIGNLKLLRCLSLPYAKMTLLPKVMCTLYSLQTLNLEWCSDLLELPDSIGNLKHLRYLNLSKTPINRLPESLGNLCHLQTLILCWCEGLVGLPTSLKALIKLCHLDVGGTKLRSMPLDMGKLTKLQKLSDFFLGKQCGSNISELGKLQKLRGSLRIWNLQNIDDAQSNWEANLMGFKHIEDLGFHWGGTTGNSMQVLEKLKPHTGVKHLQLRGYGGTNFPNWMGDPSFSNIVCLYLVGCKNCSSLPPLGQLESLETLHISKLDRVTTIGPEFYGNCTTIPFRSLKSLTFEEMPQWKEWISNVDNDQGDAFPLLEELCVKDCPDLRKALPNHMPSLIKLDIQQCKRLVVSPLSAQASLQIKLRDGARNVVVTPHCLIVFEFQFHAPDLPLMLHPKCGLSVAIEKIVFNKCESLKCFPLGLEFFPKLKILVIDQCPNFSSLFGQKGPLGNYGSLNGLEISDCPMLKSLPENMQSLFPNLVVLIIGYCPELESFPEGGLPSKLESLHIDGCNKLFTTCINWDLRTLLSLSHFGIGTCKDLESFPGKILLPSTLTSLRISNLENLKFLNSKELQHLTSLGELKIELCPLLQSLPGEGFPSSLTSVRIWNLQNLESLYYNGTKHLNSLRRLEIYNCPKLQSLPEEGLPSFLSFLWIVRCPLLEQRCQLGKGEDWPKIRHVQDVWFNGQNVKLSK